MSYTNGIGASYDKSTPDFKGNLTESEIYTVLQLIIKHETGMTLPITHNGLGYNNLILWPCYCLKCKLILMEIF